MSVRSDIHISQLLTPSSLSFLDVRRCSRETKKFLGVHYIAVGQLPHPGAKDFYASSLQDDMPTSHVDTQRPVSGSGKPPGCSHFDTYSPEGHQEEL